MMSRTEQLRAFIASSMVALEDGRVLGDEDNIFELGFVDSLFALELVSFVESEFGLALSDEDLTISNFSSISAILALLSSNDRGQK